MKKGKQIIVNPLDAICMPKSETKREYYRGGLDRGNRIAGGGPRPCYNAKPYKERSRSKYSEETRIYCSGWCVACVKRGVGNVLPMPIDPPIQGIRMISGLWVLSTDGT